MTASQVVEFWRAAGPARWFTHDAAFDRAIAEQFGDAHLAAARGALAGWEADGVGALALLILTDQFPRNIYRGSAHAFATDAMARAVCERALARGLDRPFAPELRQFFYLPFQHEENAAAQARAIALYEKLVADGGDPKGLDYAHLHADLIARYTSRVILVFDSDAAGQSATERGIDVLLRKGIDVSVLRLPDGEDPDTFVRKFGAKEFERRIGESVSFLEFKARGMKISGDLDAPERATDAIRSIVTSIALIPDALKRELYVQKLAADYHISEALMADELERALGKQGQVRRRELPRPPAPATPAAPNGDAIDRGSGGPEAGPRPPEPGQTPLRAPEPPTAIIASNDQMTLATLEVARERGLSVPEDLSLISFDNTPIVRFTMPALTAVDQPIAATASRAVELIIDAQRGTSTPQEPVVVQASLVRRQSTARVPAAVS